MTSHLATKHLSFSEFKLIVAGGVCRVSKRKADQVWPSDKHAWRNADLYAVQG